MSNHAKGFSLIELLVVSGMIAGLSLLLLGGLAGSGRPAALQSAQATMAGVVVAARTSAMASGKSARILIHDDPSSDCQPSRYLRYVVVQTQGESGWLTVTELFLPEGIYILPGNFSDVPAGLFTTQGAVSWTRADGSPLRSTALRSNQIVSEIINNSGAEQWVGITISANPGTAQSGDIVLAAGRRRPPGSYLSGESPVELTNPEFVRGLKVSAYAVAALIDRRDGF